MNEKINQPLNGKIKFMFQWSKPAIENGHHLQWIYPLKIVIFHGYVSLPKGRSFLKVRELRSQLSELRIFALAAFLLLADETQRRLPVPPCHQAGFVAPCRHRPPLAPGTQRYLKIVGTNEGDICHYMILYVILLPILGDILYNIYHAITNITP